ncbi:hypothetical protein CSV60_13230 [Sporosarcina sp. P7]|nr:hypothetical protein CSV60_13230 [Sporosarcina sp. P7]
MSEMADQDPKYSRTSRKQGNKASKVNKALNISIGVVVFLIAVVAIIFINGNDDQQEMAIDEPKQSTQSETAPIEPIVLDDEDELDKPEAKEPNEAEEPEAQTQEEENEVINEVVEEPEAPVVEAPKVEEPKKVEPKKEKPKRETSSDSGKKVVVNPDWKPIGTKQTGEHVSKYDGQSDDWFEKKKAIAYATGMSEDQMYFERIQNGGSPQKSEGIVRSKDNSKKYKVYLEWVDGQGWKPVRMEILK